MKKTKEKAITTLMACKRVVRHRWGIKSAMMTERLQIDVSVGDAVGTSFTSVMHSTIFNRNIR
jgi:hypothetical protein